jgi:acyl phosphate:glycerol-3-phosphate acyltransferase
MDTGGVLVAVISVVAAYFIGGIPFGVVVARVVGGPDPRTVGSGRTGGANTLRALGPAAALVAGLLDAAKGAVAVAIPILLGGGILIQALAALAAIVGHSRSPYIGFAGGRGVAPGFGGLLVIQPWIAALIVPVFFGVLAVSRYSSLASLTASATGGAVLAGLAVVTHLHVGYVAYAVAGPALIWLFHADNIQRLLSGEERKIEFRR